MKTVIGFPTYKRLNTSAVQTIEGLLDTDADHVLVGCTPEEYEEHSHRLPRASRLTYCTCVAGRGCGGDMRETAIAMSLMLDDPKDIMIMCDDDVKMLKIPPSVKEWASYWLHDKEYACAFAFDQSNFWLRREWAESGIKRPGRGEPPAWYQEVLRNQGPVLAFTKDAHTQVGSYDASFHTGNDADIQQRFNLLGDSIVSDEWLVQKGSFQEGGMSAFFESKSWGGSRYKMATAEAVYKAKVKYPWMAGAGVTILKNGDTRANWRVHEAKLQEYREMYKWGGVDMNAEHLIFNPIGEAMDKELTARDWETIEKLKIMWPNWEPQLFVNR